MKKLFAIFALCGAMTFGLTLPSVAQEDTTAPAAEQTETVQETAEETAAPAAEETVVQEEKGLHKELKTKFIEGMLSL